MKKQTIIHNEADKMSFISILQKAKIEKAILVETSVYKPKRSLAINRLLWLWNGEIQKHIRETQGHVYSVDDIHEYFVTLLLPNDVIEINGKEKTIRAHTSKMNNKEMCLYLELLDMYCAEHLNLILPHPEDLYLEAMK